MTKKSKGDIERVFEKANKDGSQIAYKLNPDGDFFSRVDISIVDMNLLDNSVDEHIQSLRKYQHKARLDEKAFKKRQKEKEKEKEKGKDGQKGTNGKPDKS